MRSKLYIFWTITLCFFFYTASAQIEDVKPDDRVEIILKDGNKITGVIKSMSATEVVIITQSLGEIKIPKENVEKIVFTKQQADVILDNSGFPTDFHNSTHYFALPSGYGLKEGQKYYENIGVFFNTFSFGITDNFSISVGGEIASLLFAARVPIMYISPKFSLPFQNESGSFAVSTIFFTSPADDFEGFGLIQGALTKGSRNNNFTIGVGFGFTTEGFGDEVVQLQFSYMGRMSRKISFVTDNIFILTDNFDSSTGVISAGIRIHYKRPGNALNLGLFRPLEEIDNFIAFPFVSATIALGDK